MGVSRRDVFKVGISSALAYSLTGFVRPARAENYSYDPPENIPYSEAREEINQIIGKGEKPHILKVREGVWSAIGYALGNSILIETDEGSVIIDTTESPAAMKEIIAEFRKRSNQPIKYVIYTHNHADHYRGTHVFYEPEMTVVAHEQFIPEVKLQAQRGRRSQMGAVAMFGLLFPREKRFPSLSIWPEPGITRLRWDQVAPDKMIWPTKTFADQYSFRLGGLSFNLIHTPGETPDQIIVHVPEYNMVCCADNFYASFPNLYTIRGTSYRPVMEWAEAQDAVIKLSPEILVPAHGQPVYEKDKIKNVLENYRDAISHVHEEALQAARDAVPIDEAVGKAVLPNHLAELPYLQEFYGSVEYSFREIYHSLVGWFDGDPVNLQPQSRKDLGADVLAIAGSTGKVLEHAESAQKEGRHQAALELCEMVLLNYPDNQAARRMKIASLTAMSRQSVNAATVNWYRTFSVWEQQKI